MFSLRDFKSRQFFSTLCDTAVVSLFLPCVIATIVSSFLPWGIATIVSSFIPCVIATIVSSFLPCVIATIVSSFLPCVIQLLSVFFFSAWYSYRQFFSSLHDTAIISSFLPYGITRIHQRQFCSPLLNYNGGRSFHSAGLQQHQFFSNLLNYNAVS